MRCVRPHRSYVALVLNVGRLLDKYWCGRSSRVEASLLLIFKNPSLKIRAVYCFRCKIFIEADAAKNVAENISWFIQSLEKMLSSIRQTIGNQMYFFYFLLCSIWISFAISGVLPYGQKVPGMFNMNKPRMSKSVIFDFRLL